MMKRPAPNRRWNLGIAGGSVVILGMLQLLGATTASSASVPHTGAPHSAVAHGRTSQTLAPPATPPAGKAYLGAWVQNDGGEGLTPSATAVQAEASETGNFQAQIGRPLALIHAYQPWNTPVSNSLLSAISSSGGIPVIDWACSKGNEGFGGTTTDIANSNVGQPLYTFITNYAQQLKTFGKPVFLRWLWEFNLQGTYGYTHCINTGRGPAADGAEFVKAWSKIRTIFDDVGATNVAFVWNPGVSGILNHGPDLKDFFPGMQNGGLQPGDWVGVDGYSRASEHFPTFTGVFDDQRGNCSKQTVPANSCSAYALLTALAPGFPVMIGETAASNPTTDPTHQRDYLNSALTAIGGGSYGAIRAFCYYDTAARAQSQNGGLWILTSAGGGLGAFIAMGQSSTFSFFGGE